MTDLNNTTNAIGDASVIVIAGKISAAVVIMLFFVVVFFFFLHLYANWLCLDDQRNPSLHSRSDPVLAALHKGIDLNVLKSLPVLVFSSEEFKEGLECSVCLSEVVDGEKARLLPKCNHGFHVDCIDMWFKSHSTCPLCRKPVSVSPKTSSRYEPVEFTSSTTFLFDSFSESSNIPDLNEGGSSSQSEENKSTSYMVIDIPMESVAEIFAAGDRNGGDEERKSPSAVLTRMQTFKRLLSRENRAVACSPSTVDV